MDGEEPLGLLIGAVVQGFSPAQLHTLRGSLRKIITNMDRLQNGDGSGTRM